MADQAAVDRFLKARKVASRHGYAGWPLKNTAYGGEFDGAKIIKNAWWVTASQTRLEVYQSVCGGDRKAGSDLLPLHLNDKSGMKDIEELTFGWIHMLESYWTLVSGAAPTDVVSRGRVKRLLYISLTQFCCCRGTTPSIL